MDGLIRPELAKQFERLPPHDLKAEQDVLGSLMLCGEDKEAFALIRAAVRRDNFFQADHQILFDVLCAMDDAGKPIDTTMLIAELKQRGLYEEIGGRDYLAQILNYVPSYSHGKHYAGIVRELYMLRSAIAIANDMLRRANSPAGPERANVLLRDAAEKCLDLISSGVSDKFVRLQEAAERAMQKKLDGNVLRIKTGLMEVDDVIGGVPVRKFTLVAGRPGMGKSQLCKQIALNAALAKVPSAVVTVEEDEGKVAENILSNLSGIENRRIAYGNFGPEDWREASEAIKRMSGLDMWINDQPAKLSEVEEAVTAAALKHKCPLVIVDYLQLIDPDTPSENENREVTKISKALKRLAKRLNIALIAACQLNRGNETSGVRLPTLRDLRGSGSLEQDGDLIILLHRNDYYLPEDQAGNADQQLKAIVAKNKDGPTGIIPLYFDCKTQRIQDWNKKPTRDPWA